MFHRFLKSEELRLGAVIVLRPLQHRSNKEEQFTGPFAGFKNFFGSREVYLNSESGIQFFPPSLFPSFLQPLSFPTNPLFFAFPLVPTLPTFALNRPNETFAKLLPPIGPARAPYLITKLTCRLIRGSVAFFLRVNDVDFIPCVPMLVFSC